MERTNRLLATLVKEGEPSIRVITNGADHDYQLYMGKTAIMEWDLGDTVEQKIAQGFIEIKKSEGYQSKEV